MADIFGSTEENNYIDVTKRDNAAESMKMVIAGTGGYSTPSYDSENTKIYQEINTNDKYIKCYEAQYKQYKNKVDELVENLSKNAGNEKEEEEIGKELEYYSTLYGIAENNVKKYEDKNKELKDKLKNPIKYQEEPNNLVSSENGHRVHDGQKRFKTLGKTTSSKYPRPKTLFYVDFNANKDKKIGITSDECLELSKFVMNVTKPNVQYTTKEMNQYNRKKFIIENVKYGQLKITFIDVKDNPIQQTFFKYLRYNNNDFKENGNKESNYRSYKENDKTNFDDVDWGLNINSSKHMFNYITIYEMFLDRLMVYRVENPTLQNINFGENKIGDFGYNEITVTFDVEGITNILDYKTEDGKTISWGDNVIGEQINRIGGADLAHYLGMRWYQGDGASDKEDNDNNFISVLNSYKNAGIRNYSIQKTKDLLSKVNENIELEDYINEIDKSFKMGNNASQYNWFAEAGYYSDNQQQVLQAGYSSKDYGYTGSRKTYYELSRNNEELAELGRANDSEYSSGNALDALLGVVKNPQDVSKMFSPRIKQLTDYFKF